MFCRKVVIDVGQQGARVGLILACISACELLELEAGDMNWDWLLFGFDFCHNVVLEIIIIIIG